MKKMFIRQDSAVNSLAEKIAEIENEQKAILNRRTERRPALPEDDGHLHGLVDIAAYLGVAPTTACRYVGTWLKPAILRVSRKKLIADRKRVDQLLVERTNNFML